MELVDIIDIIINEPVYLTITVFLLLIIVYSILKKIFKLMIIGLSCLIIYVSYLIFMLFSYFSTFTIFIP